MGTPRYMAPEQCRGGVQIDDKADVYSMGIMLYEMLAGSAPFQGGGGEVLAMHIYETPKPLREVAPYVPEELALLVHRLIAKKKEDRPSMRQVTQELEQLSLRHPTQALQAIQVQQLLASGGLTPRSNPALTPAGGSLGAGQPSTLGLSSGQATAQRSKVPLLAVIIGVVLLVGVGTLVLLRPREVVSTTTPKPIPSKPDLTEQPPINAAPKKVRWTITSFPTGALIVRSSDQQALGQTPWELEQPVGTGAIELKLRLAGHAERTVRMSLSTDEKHDERLDPLPPVTRGGKSGKSTRNTTGGKPTAGTPKKNEPTTETQPRIVD